MGDSEEIGSTNEAGGERFAGDDIGLVLGGAMSLMRIGGKLIECRRKRGATCGATDEASDALAASVECAGCRGVVC